MPRPVLVLRPSPMRLRRAALVVLSVLGGFAATSGCTLEASRDAGASAPGGGDPDSDGAGEVPSSEAEVRASCTDPRLYFTVRAEGGCEVVTAKRGRWTPSPVFRDAPPEVQRLACAYRWAGPKGASPDRRALELALGERAALAPVCGADAALVPVRGNAARIEGSPIGGLAGSVGCDVCGIVWQNKLWVVISPDVSRRQVSVPLSTGTTDGFELASSSARAVVIDLPPATAGEYRQGVVPVY